MKLFRFFGAGLFLVAFFSEAKAEAGISAATTASNTVVVLTSHNGFIG